MPIALASGDRLGPYEILAPLGIGGMGEVYRARDPRIGREVAVKVLRASLTDADHIPRLEKEARAAGALNHPNILAVFDVGNHEGTPYVVSELLEGQTLRDRMLASPLVPRKVVDYAVQVAHGLAVAHAKGICHQDIKPENLFLTRDGRVKILDFGLAKLLGPLPETRAGSEDSTASGSSLTGVPRGTVGYMAPEQVRGERADQRSDIFACGAVLYEMLSGRRAFRGASVVETMNAILKEDPPDLLETAPGLAPGLAHVVRRCLEKSPEERFQSARDLAFHLQELQGASFTGGAALDLGPARKRGRRKVLLALLSLLVLVAAALLALRVLRERPLPTFQQLTFHRGRLVSARFAPDGQSIVYSAAWETAPLAVFSSLPGSPESRSLGHEGADILAISPSGEMALSLGYRYAGGERFLGTLARAPLGGGAPREVLENVEDADWAPDGANLAVVRSTGAGGASRLEYPIGKSLYDTTGSIRHPRVSPNGDRVAFLDDPAGLGFVGSVAVVDLGGRKTTLTRHWANARGLDWSPSGEEIWFTAAEAGLHRALRAVSLSGRQRLVAVVPGSMTLRDVASDGRALLTRDEERRGILGVPPGQTTERELSWFDGSGLGDLSSDGRTLLFGDRFGVYLRKTDGSPAVRLGDGFADALSPDGKWALATTESSEQLLLLPTGAGEPKLMPRHNLTSYGGARWFPDGKRILFNGREPGHGLRAYVQDLEGGLPHPITPDGTWAISISTDAREVAAIAQGQGISLHPVEGGEPHTVPGSEPGDRPVGWTADGRALWVFRRGEIPARVYRLGLATGHRELWKKLMPADPAGVFSITQFRTTPSGDSYFYSYRRILSDLYLVKGLK